ncbi:MAG: hypothetical protein HN757_04040 [Calditrichaeota bacterium]|nr:hypothetical protein [Calditrichota bacterium]
MADQRHRERRREDRRKIHLGVQDGWEGAERRKITDRRLIDPISGKPKPAFDRSTAGLKKQREILRRQKERKLSDHIKKQRSKKDMF